MEQLSEFNAGGGKRKEMGMQVEWTCIDQKLQVKLIRATSSEPSKATSTQLYALCFMPQRFRSFLTHFWASSPFIFWGE
ncbi:hypothetical protein X798_04334 [Onchocerca flexuosa]|uniref:Uncharacterized protein n=1 Tax=Onchocerca flexuosa TaxID=387005 RepID=A0A238BTM3_9BILA|nr:hypothetical protein X798_04334 [Onchocerca flexuosa]